MVDYEIEDMINKVLFGTPVPVSRKAVKTLATSSRVPASATHSVRGDDIKSVGKASRASKASKAPSRPSTALSKTKSNTGSRTAARPQTALARPTESLTKTQVREQIEAIR